jgi:uncharacterized protein YjbJ (UPF0337 family)
MVNQEMLVGKWNEVSGKIKEKWGNLADDDLTSFSGNIDQLVGKIQRKTGESRAAIEQFLGEVSGDTVGALGNLRDRAQQGMEAASSTVRQGMDSMRQGISDAEQCIADRPAQSMAVAFGLGVVAGVGLALLFRERPSESTMVRGRHAAEQFGRQMMDAISGMMPQR